MFPYALILKFNPNHGKDGRFAKAAYPEHLQKEYGSEQHLKELLSDPIRAKALYHKEVADLVKEGLVGDFADHDTFTATMGRGVTLKDMVHSLSGRTTKLEGYTLNADTRGVRFLLGDEDLFNTTQVDVHGGKADEFKREFKSDGKKDVYHDIWRVAHEDRGSGCVKRGIPKMFDFYRRAGMKTVSTYANIDAGSYAWAKYGFLPRDAKELRKVQVNALTKLSSFDTPKNRWDEPPPHLPEKDVEEYHSEVKNLKNLLTSKSKHALQALSDLKTPILDSVHKPKVSTTDADGNHKDYKQVRMAQYLMNANGWHGTFNLNDKRQASRMANYISGVDAPNKLPKAKGAS